MMMDPKDGNLHLVQQDDDHNFQSSQQEHNDDDDINDHPNRSLHHDENENGLDRMFLATSSSPPVYHRRHRPEPPQPPIVETTTATTTTAQVEVVAPPTPSIPPQRSLVPWWWRWWWCPTRRSHLPEDGMLRIPPTMNRHTKAMAQRLARRLYGASDILLAKLFTYLSNLPPPPQQEQEQLPPPLPEDEETIQPVLDGVTAATGADNHEMMIGNHNNHIQFMRTKRMDSIQSTTSGNRSHSRDHGRSHCHNHPPPSGPDCQEEEEDNDDNEDLYTSGMTLPISALAWLSSQIIHLRKTRQQHQQHFNDCHTDQNYNTNNMSFNHQIHHHHHRHDDLLSHQHHHHEENDHDYLDASSLDCDRIIMEPQSRPELQPTGNEQEYYHHHHHPALLWMGASIRDRLLLIHFLLPRATHVRIVSQEWPSSSSTVKHRRRHRRRHHPTTSIHHLRQVDEEEGDGEHDDESVPTTTIPIGGTSASGGGHDLAFSTISVQSALTEENYDDGDDDDALVPSTISDHHHHHRDYLASTFLYNYHHLQQRPRIMDISILFPNLQVLVLDQVPPECILDVYHIRHTLRILRIERACIYHLSQFLFSTTNPHHTDPHHHNTIQDDNNNNYYYYQYSQLTHIKLSHCCIGEMSGLKGQGTLAKDENAKLRRSRHHRDSTVVETTTTTETTKTSTTTTTTPPRNHSTSSTTTTIAADGTLPSFHSPPPFSQCPKLVSLCLSHNQLRRPSTALAGLSSCSWLQKLDLSYNQLESMKHAHWKLGNIKILVLTGNKIRSAHHGLDRLFALEQLWLDYNDISDLASIHGLGRLPDLTTLHLNGNPLAMTTPVPSNNSNNNNNNNNHQRTTVTSSSSISSSSWRYHHFRYRVDVLNLFMMCRLTSLGPGATYRQLQSILPILDGIPASISEMVDLRDRTFRPILPPTTPIPRSVAKTSSCQQQRQQQQQQRDDKNFDHADDLNKSKENENDRLLDQNCSDDDVDARDRFLKCTMSVTPKPPSLYGQRSQSNDNSIRGNRIQRRARRHRAIIEDSWVMVAAPPEKRREPKLIVGEDDGNNELRATSMEQTDHDDANDDGHTSMAVATAKLQRDMNTLTSKANVAFSVQDVISAISGNLGINDETNEDKVPPTQDGSLPIGLDQHVMDDTITMETTIRPSSNVESGAEKGENHTVLPNQSTFHPGLHASTSLQDITLLSLSTIKQDDDDHEIDADDEDRLRYHQDVESNDESQFLNDKEKGLVISASLENQTKETTSQVFTNPFDDDADAEEKMTTVPVEEFQLATNTTVTDDQIATTAPSKAQPGLSSASSTAQPASRDASSVESLSENNVDRMSVSFTEDVWQDDQSVRSSVASDIGTGRNEHSAEVQFALAEKNCIYDGPPAYQDLLVLDHLELYFRSFVFSTTLATASSFVSSMDDGVMDGDCSWQTILNFCPRLQLPSIDRQLMMMIFSANHDIPGTMLPSSLSQFMLSHHHHREQFVRVWKENVIACGKPAARRLFPNRHTRLGFHGDILWNKAGKIYVVTEPRRVILCLSNVALYFILDHDAVTDKLIERKTTQANSNTSNAFPWPISKDAKFRDAPWPHAVARHPLLSLQQVTIGFGFQRLILRFSNATYPSDDHFTYNLLISNKVEAISLLQDLQRYVKEVAALSSSRSTTTGFDMVSDSSSGCFSLDDDSWNKMRLEIDNDDKHFLESLASAVAPDVIEAVIHYQILHQRWLHGDRGSVRRSCVVTDSKLFLLDEDYTGDGSLSFDATDDGGMTGQQLPRLNKDSDGTKEALQKVKTTSTTTRLGDVRFRLVDSADLKQIIQVKAADADPKAITIVIRPSSRLSRTHRWRLLCRDGEGAERLVEDVRKAIALI